MDAFTWSLPFVGLKSTFFGFRLLPVWLNFRIVTEMLLAILSICTQEELAESDESEGEAVNTEDIAERKQMIKNKILAVGKMQRVFQLLRSGFLIPISVFFFFKKKNLLFFPV